MAKKDFTIHTMVEGYRCLRCNYKWMPKKKNVMPKNCPSCNSPYWDKPRQKDLIDFLVKNKK